jgi:hypothetical protein
MRLHDSRRSLACLAVLIGALRFASSARGDEPATIDELRINQIQVVGTHNSYHVRKQTGSNSRGVPEWNYTHAPLDVQLDRGVRSFELDLHYKNGEFEVFHVPIVDEGSNCGKLSEALATVRKWSDAHPGHVPISFLFELKKEGPRLDSRIKEPDAAALDKLDELLRAPFADGHLISPDDVRGTAPTLRQAIESNGWPTLGASRGKVFFILHDDGPQRALYTKDHPSLRGRVMFVRSNTERDDGATLVLDNPRSPDIPRLVKANYFVRTRADSDLLKDPTRAEARREAALSSGAHILSTDFPAGEAHESGYSVEFPESAAARVNPVNGPEKLRGQRVPEQQSPSSRLQTIVAPYVDLQTLIVVHADLMAFEVPGTLDAFAKHFAWPDQLRDFMKAQAAPIEVVTQTLPSDSTADIFLVSSLLDIARVPFYMVLPLDNATPAGAIAVETRRDIEREFRRPVVTEHIGKASITGSPETIERLKKSAPVARPELAAAFAATVDSAVQIAVVPSVELRKLLGGIVPQLPSQLGGGATKTFTEGIAWAAIGVDLPPAEVAVHVIIQSTSPEAAAALEREMPRLLEAIGKLDNVRDSIKDFDELAKRLVPKASGDQLRLDLTEDDGGITALATLAGPIVRALTSMAGAK